MVKKTESKPHRIDYAFAAIIALVSINAIWLLLMPWVPSIASATIHRFHLRSGSFAWWAIQQPIPSMYNFSNRFEVSDLPPGFLDPRLILFDAEKRYVNHFPARMLTFANRRYRYLHDGQDRWVTIETSYRGQTLETRFHARHRESGGYDIVNLSQTDVP